MYHDSQRSNEEFKEHNAVVSKTAQLVNSGDYIQLCTPVSQVREGAECVTMDICWGVLMCKCKGVRKSVSVRVC